MTPHLDTLFLVLMVASAVAVLAARDLLAAVIVLGAFSFFSAMFFASLGALDVAFTEAAVGAGISTVLFVTAIFRTERGAPGSGRGSRASRLAGTAALAAVAGVLFVSAAALPDVGDPAAPPSRHVSPRYVDRGPSETGAPNLVTGVLADYRGYDTLGETVVIFTAGLACLLALGTGRRGARP